MAYIQISFIKVLLISSNHEIYEHTHGYQGWTFYENSSITSLSIKYFFIILGRGSLFTFSSGRGPSVRRIAALQSSCNRNGWGLVSLSQSTKSLCSSVCRAGGISFFTNHPDWRTMGSCPKSNSITFCNCHFFNPVVKSALCVLAERVPYDP